MAFNIFPVVLGITLIPFGPILAFKSVDFAKFPGTAFQMKKKDSPGLVNKMKELQEQFGTAVKAENKTKEEVVAVKNKVDELAKMVQGSEEAAAQTNDKVKEITDRMMKFEANLAKAEQMQSSVDEAVKTAEAHKIDIADLKANKVNMNAKITNLDTALGKVSKEIADTKAEVEEKLSAANKFAQQSGGNTVVEYAEPAEASMTADQCPSPFNFIEKSGQCLMVSKDKASDMATGSAKCAEMHERGSLAILDTSEKQDGAKDYLRRQGVGSDVLVGGSMNAGTYRWMNDAEVDTSTGWCAGQPSDNLGCVSLWRGRGFCLDDTHCDAKTYLCEVEAEEEDYFEG